MGALKVLYITIIIIIIIIIIILFLLFFSTRACPFSEAQETLLWRHHKRHISSYVRSYLLYKHFSYIYQVFFKKSVFEKYLSLFVQKAFQHLERTLLM